MSRALHFTNKTTNQIYGQANLVTDLLGRYQFGAWVDVAREVHVGRIERGVQRWGVDHDHHLMAGAERTALGLPVANDEHNSPSLWLVHDPVTLEVSRVYLGVNMHVNDMRIVRATSGINISAWEAFSFSGVTGSDWTYPQPCQLPSGGVSMSIRKGGSGNGDLYECRIAAGASSGALGGIWLARTGNFNAYLTPPKYDPVRERWWMSWAWRDQAGNPDVYNPSIAYSNAEMTEWFNIDGDPIGWPLTEASDECSFPVSITGGEAALTNWGSICIDADGNPHNLISRNPAYHVWHDGDSWQQEQIGATTGTNLYGTAAFGRFESAYINDKLHVFAGGVPYTGSASEAYTGDKHTVLSAWDLEDEVSFQLSGEFEYTLSGGWESNMDQIAHRLFGTAEFLVPYDTVPYVVSYGVRAPVRASA